MWHKILVPAAIMVAALQGTQTAAQEEQKIKQVLDRAIAHLKHTQQKDGSWPHAEKTGMTALVGLALLQAGLAKNDPAIVKAAAYVREKVPDMTHTYSVSLALLFLDRLEWKQDVALLEGLAVRLLMGQNDYGGWSYHCQLPREKEIGRLEAVAKEVNATVEDKWEPRKLTHGRELLPEIKAILAKMEKERKIKNNENQHLGDTSNTLFASLALGATKELGIPLDHAMAQVDRRFGLTISRGGWSYYPGRPPQQQIAVNVPIPVEGFEGNPDRSSALGNLRTVYRSVVLDAGQGGVDRFWNPPGFKYLSGILAPRNIIVKSKVFPPPGFPPGLRLNDIQRDPKLVSKLEWVITADIPVGRVGDPAPVLSLPKVRFQTMVLTGPPSEMTLIESQGETGTLSPNPRSIWPTPTMTADGISCLALGIAANREPPPFLGHNSESVHLVRKKCIFNALQGIAPAIGEPQKDLKKVPKLKKDNTYYLLFSVNQMAQLLGLKTIGGKDYHAWGTQLLLANQKENGSWEGNFGAADTAFAVMFLSKANLVPAATERLKGEFRDPGPLQILQKKESPEPVNGKVAKDKTPPKTLDPEVAEQMALEKLKAAKATLKDGKLELAKVRLVIIVDDYPMTRAAIEAQKLLVEVERKLKSLKQ